MRTLCLVACSVLWGLHACGVSGDGFSLVWLGASLLPLSAAVGNGWPVFKMPP